MRQSTAVDLHWKPFDRHQDETAMDMMAPFTPIIATLQSANNQANSNTAMFKQHTLNSAFQPIYSIAHRRPVGYEALIRPSNELGEPVSPMHLFSSSAHDEAEAVALDRLCRQLHLANFTSQEEDEHWLFLNVNPRVAIGGKKYGAFFQRLLEHYNFPPERVVIEILENAIDDEKDLVTAASYYRDLGCLIAIDDFGAGHSNFNRIWRIRPDIVKLDRSIIVQAEENPFVRRVFPNLVGLIHESGSLALSEGIETEAQAIVAMDAGIDLVQGYLLGKPHASIDVHTDTMQIIPHLCNKYREFYEAESQRTSARLQHYVDLFGRAAQSVADGISLSQSCAELLQHPLVERCFLLDEEGQQTEPNIIPPGRNQLEDPRFTPVSDARGAIWSRRHYFRKAMAQPEHIQITRPYLSIIGATMCITLSIALQTNGLTRVFCCDLSWEES